MILLFSMDSMLLAATFTMDVSMPGNDIPAIEAHSAQLFYNDDTAMPSNFAVHTYDDLRLSIRFCVIQAFLHLCAYILEALLN
jgi:hypothetical protein